MPAEPARLLTDVFVSIRNGGPPPVPTMSSVPPVRACRPFERFVADAAAAGCWDRLV